MAEQTTLRTCSSLFLKLLSFLTLAALGAFAVYSSLPQRSLEGNTAEEATRIVAGVPVHNYDIRRPVATSHFRRLRGEKVYDWILQFKGKPSDDTIHDLCKTLAATNAECLFEGHPDQGGLPVVVLRSTMDAFDSILVAHGHLLEFAEADSEITAIEVDSEGSVPWGLDRIDARSGLDGSYGSNVTGKGVHVYVTDTGIRTTHQDFKASDSETSRAVPSIDLTSGSLKVCSDSDNQCAADRQGHGTHCAGSIGGSRYGVAKEATLHAVKVLSDNGSGSFSWFIQALEWVAINGQRPAIISASLGGSGRHQSAGRAVAKAVEAGVTVVVAAGNSADDACRYTPAFAPEAITVGATDRRDKMASFSNYGPCTDIFAPGVEILSAGIQSDTAERTLSGTSMAAPHVAGAAALILASDRSLSPADVVAKLRSRATPYVLQGVQSSDNLLLYTGDSPSVVYTTTTTTTTTATFGDRTWIVTEGPCTIDAAGCAKRENYGPHERCTILVNPDRARPISVQNFETEWGYDGLTINSIFYSGNSTKTPPDVRIPFPLGAPVGIIPQGVITWRSDSAFEGPGWKICMPETTTVTITTTTTSTVTTTTTTSTVNFADKPWIVSQGPCTIDAAGCVKRDNYGSSERCNILVNSDLARPISVEKFDTERDYDILTVNGKAYSGTNGPDGIVPQEEITWWSDHSIEKSGWKICMPDVQPTTTVATTTITRSTTTSSTTSTTSATSTTSTSARLIQGLTPEESAVYNPRLASFWDLNVCEKLGAEVGDNHNWEWCGEGKFECARAVNSELCSSGIALLNFTHKFAKIDGCVHAYFAQYVCKQLED